ncbi:Rho GTPase-activating protein 15 [Tritrichomonas musculus]|uniref:Rho GTPase-activating protein 15 n=1 Tax=Tritrichomonas musculus TaxID=1915356 RepID=A0ABR2IMB2_9EUKA
MSAKGKFFSTDFKSFNGKIPFIITDIVTKLDENHSETFEGIFRKNGSKQVVDLLCQELENGKVQEWKDDYLDVYVLAGTLSRYFAKHSKMFDSIIDQEMQQRLQEIYDNYKNNEEERISQYKNFFNSSSDTRKNSLAFFLKYLHKVSTYSEQNLMHAGNLSTVFYINFFPMFDEANSNKPQDISFYNGLKNSVNKQILQDLIEKGDIILEEINNENFMSDEDIQNFVFPGAPEPKKRSFSCLLI